MTHPRDLARDRLYDAVREAIQVYSPGATIVDNIYTDLDDAVGALLDEIQDRLNLDGLGYPIQVNEEG